MVRVRSYSVIGTPRILSAPAAGRALRCPPSAPPGDTATRKPPADGHRARPACRCAGTAEERPGRSRAAPERRDEVLTEGPDAGAACGPGRAQTVSHARRGVLTAWVMAARFDRARQLLRLITTNVSASAWPGSEPADPGDPVRVDEDVAGPADREPRHRVAGVDRARVVGGAAAVQPVPGRPGSGARVDVLRATGAIRSLRQVFGEEGSEEREQRPGGRRGLGGRCRARCQRPGVTRCGRCRRLGARRRVEPSPQATVRWTSGRP